MLTSMQGTLSGMMRCNLGSPCVCARVSVLDASQFDRHTGLLVKKQNSTATTGPPLEFTPGLFRAALLHFPVAAGNDSPIITVPSCEIVKVGGRRPSLGRGHPRRR